MGWPQIALAVLVVALAVAALVWREKATKLVLDLRNFLRDVVEEVKKITWPTRDDLRKMTMVIVAFVLVVALVIGAMDVVLQFLLVRLPGNLT